MGTGTPLYGDRAPTIGQYVVIAGSALLDNERTLTGTANQIVVTDNGAGSTVVLSTPQNIHTGASPTFANIYVPDGGTFGISGNELLTFNAAGSAVFSGCSVGIGVTPDVVLEAYGTSSVPNLSSDTSIFKFSSSTTVELTMGTNPNDPWGAWIQTKLNTDAGSSWPLAFNPLGGKVSIGTLSSDGTLHVHTASAGAVSAGSSSDDLVIENSDHAGISLLTPNDKFGQLVFGDPEDPDAGRLRYSHPSTRMEWYIEGSMVLAFQTTSLAFQQASAITTTTGLLALMPNTNLGIGIDAGLLGKTHIDQSSSTAAIPVLFLDQGDVSEQCIKFSSDATDRDINLFTVNVTGAPKLWWDESEDKFALTKGIAIGDGGTTNYANFAADGELTLAGTARVTKTIWLAAGGIRAPGGKPATFVSYGLTGVWQFADQGVADNQETVSGTLKIPNEMDITVAPTFHIGWSADGISPGDCEWQLEYLWIAPNDVTSGAAQETLTVTSTASSTADGFVFATITGVDVPSGTDKAMLWRIKRLSAGGNDTIADTVEMRGCALTYTANKLGTAT